MIGENIRALRKRYNETQKELAEKLNLTEQAVSHYEKGKREPDIQTIELIANHYMITPEQLIFSDFREIEDIDLSANLNQLMKLSEVLLPTFISETAIQDKSFKIGYEYLCRINNLSKKGKWVPQSLMDVCERSFIQSWNDSQTIESVANLLNLLFLRLYMYADKNEIAVGEAVFSGGKLDKSVIKKYYLRNEKYEPDKRKMKYVEKKYELVMMCIQILKERNWGELGDYYLAIRYNFGMIDTTIFETGFNQDMNRQFWVLLLCDLCQIGNKYALDCLNAIFSLYPEK